MRLILATLLTIGAMTACRTSAPPQETASPNAKRFELRGKVISVDKQAHKAKIEHEAVVGYMAGMTMDFPIHADWIWNDLSPGSEIRADLVVDPPSKEGYWLENVTISGAVKPGEATPPVDERFAQVGMEVPSFTLTNQDGKKISLADYRGKALAITFIYAKCPLPDYCVRMSTNFSDAARSITANETEKARIRLLSISFDPANDTPAALRSYGIGYMGNSTKPDFSVWQLAVGNDAEVRKIADFFGLRYEVDENDKTQINHSLRTAVIGPDGKVTKIFAGNEWTPEQLIAELDASLTKK